MTDSMINFKKGDAVQFTETHKWCGCLGIIDEIKDCIDFKRYMIGVPVPEGGTAYIFVSDINDIEYIGKAVLLPCDEMEEEYGP